MAERLIESFGGAILYIQVSESYDPVTGKTSQAETTHNVISTPPVPLSKRLASGQDFRAVYGEVFDTVQAGDLITTIKALNLGFVPEIGDKVVLNNERWQIVRIDPLYSGALAAAYTIQIRQ
ncbi:MAG: hypothetical protein OEQ39_12600 [Gammaproteobacteria bacterium]|nr:hypothetical protein [Gammaproteobacteria bacterium]